MSVTLQLIVVSHILTRERSHLNTQYYTGVLFMRSCNLSLIPQSTDRPSTSQNPNSHGKSQFYKPHCVTQSTYTEQYA